MKAQSTAPTGQPQTFDVTETFFSTTNARGEITAGNHVFCRISGYSFEEMCGQPHNIIRHPDMPRLVFRLLWETIGAGRTFMGYVKNHARNGNHYWVFAVVVPVPQGYLSVRIKPTSALLPRVEALYAELAVVEAQAVAAGRSESQAAEVARGALDAAVRDLGFASYAALSHHALNTEIKGRDAEIAARALRLFPEELQAGNDNGQLAELRKVYAETLAAYAGVNRLFASLDLFTEVAHGIRERQAAVQRISEDFRLNALNAHIAAHPLGAEGVTLGTVAQILNGHGQSLSRNVRSLAETILETTVAVADITSNLSAARIQVEMLLSFLAEIAERESGQAEQHKLHAMTEDLRIGFKTTVAQAFRALQTIERNLPQVLGTKEQLRKDIVYLQVAQISGLVEVSRLSDSNALHATFTGLRSQIEHGKSELEQLDAIVEKLKELSDATPPLVQLIDRAMQDMQTALGKPTGAASSPARVLLATPEPRAMAAEFSDN
jgi:aerotaxis receptor